MAHREANTIAPARGRRLSKTLRMLRRSVAGFVLLGLLWSTQAAAQAIPPNCPSNLGTANVIDHDFSVSFCELCSTGTVTLEIENPYRDADDADFSDLVITEDLQISGLTYVPGTTRFSTDNVPTPPVVEPVVSGDGTSEIGGIQILLFDP